MAKSNKENQLTDEATEALEIIELSIDDLDLLARAFQLIEQACGCQDQESESSAVFESEAISTVIH